MGILALKADERVTGVIFTEDEMSVSLRDGRTISVPLSWYPRLLHGSKRERMNWVVAGAGYGIHWPDLDEDLGVEGLLRGEPSAESGKSLQRWLDARPVSSVEGAPKRGSRKKKAAK